MRRLGRIPAALRAGRAIAVSAFGFEARERGKAESLVKPGISCVLIVMLACWASCALCYTIARYLSMTVLGVLVAFSAACALLCAIAILRRSSITFAWALALGLTLGVTCSSYGALSLKSGIDGIPTSTGSYSVRLVEDAKEGPFAARAKGIATDSKGCSFPVEVKLPADGSAYLFGARFQWEGSLRRLDEKALDFNWSRGIAGSLDATRIDPGDVIEPSGPGWLRVRALQVLSSYGSNHSEILQALICGYQAPAEREGIYEAYKITGLAHIVAVSGSHLAIIAAAVECLFGLMRLGASRRRVAVIAFVGIYLLFSGASISAVRAAIMVVLTQCASFSGRRSSAANALAVCMMLYLVADPASSVSVSLFLSAAATLGIVLFSGLVESWLEFLPRPLARILVEPTSLTLASSLLTLPLSAALFSQLPLISPIANILAVPLFSTACVAGLAAAVGGVLVPDAASMLGGIASLCVTPLAEVVDALARVPYACVPVDLPVAPMIAISALLACVLYIAWPRFSPRAVGLIAAGSLVACAALLSPVLLHRASEVVMLDIGQGDAFVIRSEGRSVLVDTGTDDAKLRRALARHGIYRLDAVIITHADDDHCGSLEALDSVASIGEVLLAQDTFTCGCDSCTALLERCAQLDTDRGVSGLRIGDVVALGKFSLKVIAPSAFADEGGNADSVCLLAGFDGNDDGNIEWTALFCGDAEADELESLVEDGLLGRVDVLKVGHHGSRVSLSPELVDVLRPSVALISCGANNRYGHPAREPLAILYDAGARVLRTDESGDVKLSYSSSQIKVATQVK